jgi:hypothetical protein
MQRVEGHQIAGQILCEMLASNDRTSRYWPEWRDLSPDDKEDYANAAIKVWQRLQEDQEGD